MGIGHGSMIPHSAPPSGYVCGLILARRSSPPHAHLRKYGIAMTRQCDLLDILNLERERLAEIFARRAREHELDAIIDRAKHYYVEVYAQREEAPATFLVSAREYDVLQRCTVRPVPVWVISPVETLRRTDHGPMYLFGMRVVTPAVLA